jgi:hypothetical protein
VLLFVVRECAEHFGECSVAEMELLRDSEFLSLSSFDVCDGLNRISNRSIAFYSFTDLHKERLQNFMFGGEGNMPKPQALEHRMLEEDLDLQLHLLKEQDHSFHNPKLFPDVEPDMQELPHLKDHTPKKDTEQLVHSMEHNMAMVETVMEESNLEALAVCMTLAVIWYLPQLFNLGI